MQKTFILLMMISKFSLAQEISFSGATGYAQGEGKTFKKIMLYTEVTGGYERQIKYDYFFFVGVGKAALQFSYTDTGNINIFNSRNLITTQLAVKKYFFLNKRSWFFFQLGPAFNYYISDKKELKSYLIDETIKTNNLGWSLGIKGVGSYKRLISDRSSFDIGFETQETYLLRYKNNSDNIDLKTKSLRLAFSWSLSKN